MDVVQRGNTTCCSSFLVDYSIEVARVEQAHLLHKSSIPVATFNTLEQCIDAMFHDRLTMSSNLPVPL